MIAAELTLLESWLAKRSLANSRQLYSEGLTINAILRTYLWVAKTRSNLNKRLAAGSSQQE